MVGKEATAVWRISMRWRNTRRIGADAARRLLLCVAAVFICCVDDTTTFAQNVSSEPIRVSGDSARRWNIADAQALLFEGDCVLQHEGSQLQAKSVLMVTDGPRGKVRTRLVIDGVPNHKRSGELTNRPITATIYTVDDPIVQSPRYRRPPEHPPALLKYLPDSNPAIAQVQFQSDASIPPPFQVPPPHSGLPEQPFSQSTQPSLQRGPSDLPIGGIDADSIAIESPAGQQTALQPPIITDGSGFLSPAPSQGLVVDNIPPAPVTFGDGATSGGWLFTVGGGSRSVEVKARNASMPPDFSNQNRDNLNETVVVARGGVTVLVRDVSAQLPTGRSIDFGTVSLSADRIVLWMPTFADLFSGKADLSQSQGELYLEGDIVFRQGSRVIYAERMYYNVAQERGVVLDAETITTIPEYQGIVRLKADVMQQIALGNFVAFDAALTSSRLGVPRYWLQSQRLQLNDRPRTVTDEQTGQPRVERQPWVSSNNNFVYLGGVPVWYWPRFSTSLEFPNFYLSGANFKNDNTFGTQVLLDWDLFQLLGIENAPKGVKWELTTDYLSDRGPALGTELSYRLPGLFGVPGPAIGFFDAWLIDDRGNDRLGNDRLSVAPEESTRGRALRRHRQYLPNDYEFIAELGWISDRNFLEQYFENEWDQDKDHDTSIRLRKYLGSNLIDLAASTQFNDFFTETERLPSLDHYLLGASRGNLLTYSAHNQVSYSKLNVADAPIDPAEAAEQSPLPGEADEEGLIASTQHELTLPVALGPVKVVPFVSGEASYYGEALDGDSLTRLIGQAGIRASLQMSKSDPTIQSSLLNVRGLAHKLDWTAEYFYADSDTNFEELPLYDPLDDDAQEQFRRRFIQDNFGLFLPGEFDPRTFALRQGLQRNVTNPSDVIADDLEQFRLGLHQRWQTKRGLPGRERIVDLLQFDVDLTIFPDEDRDNFGEAVGPLTYDFRYHIGDRFTLLTDGYIDFFDDGLRSISAGLRSSRPGTGDWYIGLLSLEGPISSTVLRGSINYRVDEKWILSGGTTFDFGSTGNIGQSFGFTRIGESLLVRLGVNVDSGRDNVSAGFSFEPRFWPSKRLGRLGGALIPPPGVDGLE